MLNNNIYVGLDVHTTNYTVTFFNPEEGTFKYERNLKADNRELVAYIRKIQKKHYSDGEFTFILGYEAGSLGYELSRYLTEHGFECKIMAPNTIKRSAKQKKTKNDLFDARLIARTLFNGDYSEVFVQTPEDEATAHLLRYRDSITQSLTKVKNQISSLLKLKGFRFNETKTKWTQAYLNQLREWIETEELESDKFVLRGLLTQYNFFVMELEETDAEIERVSQQERYAEDVANLRALKGIDTLVALNIVVTIGDIKRFKSADSFANYLGLTPGERSSGERQNQTGITKTGNSRMRRLLVLSAHTYSRGKEYCKSQELIRRQKGLDQELVLYADKGRKRCHKKFRHMRDDLKKNYNVTVCAIARELACFCWGILSGNIH